MACATQTRGNIHQEVGMRKRSIALSTGLFALVVAVAFAVTQPTTTDAAQGTQAQIDLIVGLPHVGSGGTRPTPVDIVLAIGREDTILVEAFSVDSFFDVFYVLNIGSSGQDGVRVSDFSVDSFFDVTYDTTGPKIETEMVAMSLTGTIPGPSNPGVALDAVRAAVTAAGGTTYYGHVTILK